MDGVSAGSGPGFEALLSQLDDVFKNELASAASGNMPRFAGTCSPACEYMQYESDRIVERGSMKYYVLYANTRAVSQRNRPSVEDASFLVFMLSLKQPCKQTRTCHLNQPIPRLRAARAAAENKEKSQVLK